MRRLRARWLPLLCGVAAALRFLPASAAEAAGGNPPTNLLEVRQGFSTHLTRHWRDGKPAAEPPAGLFLKTKYRSPAGDLAAYVSPSPGDGLKHPIVLWIFGGFTNGIFKTAWEPQPPEADQSASAYRTNGLLMMYPSLRGGNDNPGQFEGMFGEVDDILAAAAYAAGLDYVDPGRIYLAGHSTGGTLALLAAEATHRFRAVFAFGPVQDVLSYGGAFLPFDITERRELEMRAPGRWLGFIHTPVYVFEGDRQPSNIVELRLMRHRSQNPMLHLHGVRGANHFSLLAPVNQLIASKIVEDNGPVCNIAFSDKVLDGLLSKK